MPRPRKSVGQHKQDGTYEPSRHESRQDLHPTGKPKMPRGLTHHEKYMWNLVELNWCGAIDEGQLHDLCKVWGYLRQAMKECDKDCLNPRNRDNYLKYSQQFNRLGAQFGMSPQARTHIKLPYVPTDADEDLKRFFGVAG